MLILNLLSYAKPAWQKLHIMTWRYYLFAERIEAVSFRTMVFLIEGMVGMNRIDWPDSSLDPEDSRNIINAYIRKLATEPAKSELLHIIFAKHFYDFAFFHVAEAAQDLIPELLRASMARLWVEFEDTSPMRERIVFVTQYAARVFEWAE